MPGLAWNLIRTYFIGLFGLWGQTDHTISFFPEFHPAGEPETFVILRAAPAAPVLPRVRSKELCDFTLGHLACESLQLVQDPCYILFVKIGHE